LPADSGKLAPMPPFLSQATFWIFVIAICFICFLLFGFSYLR
jgi:hypothetical protein